MLSPTALVQRFPPPHTALAHCCQLHLKEHYGVNVHLNTVILTQSVQAPFFNPLVLTTNDTVHLGWRAQKGSCSYPGVLTFQGTLLQ